MPNRQLFSSIHIINTQYIIPNAKFNSEIYHGPKHPRRREIWLLVKLEWACLITNRRDPYLVGISAEKYPKAAWAGESCRSVFESQQENTTWSPLVRYVCARDSEQDVESGWKLLRPRYTSCIAIVFQVLGLCKYYDLLLQCSADFIKTSESGLEMFIKEVSTNLWLFFLALETCGRTYFGGSLSWSDVPCERVTGRQIVLLQK